MSQDRIALLIIGALALSFTATASAADDADTLVVPAREVVVSATRTPRNPVDVPNAIVIVTGAELRRRGVHTFAEALEDVVGLDTGEGSDNGAHLPNVGLWGLKEFDALLFTLNGVPVGGPFNPSLAQIPVEDIDRIEIVKGPQGTLHGVSAFAGMIQVFTNQVESGHGHLTGGGGSFSEGHGTLGYGSSMGKAGELRLFGAAQRSDGWQDRTRNEQFRGDATFSRAVGSGQLALDVMGTHDRQHWGTPLAFDAGLPLPGLVRDRNYAVVGARVEHQALGAATRFSYPLSSALRFENTLGCTHDRQSSVRSFPGEIRGDTLVSEGISIEPIETSVYEDARLISRFRAAGDHELVTGAALTWGRTTAAGIGFDFDQRLSEYPAIPAVDQIPVGDHRSFHDRRTFFGAYAHDAWTPAWRLTLAGGGRYDATSEVLHAQAQEVGGPLERADDSRSDHAFSGDVSVLFRTVRAGNRRLNAANLYGSFRGSFKPAAPNLSEAEGAEILEPERTRSWEAGAKVRALEQISFNASYFDMTFENMVVSILGPSGGPELTNAGKQRFKGEEVDAAWAPRSIPGASLSLGYAHHDARFVEFAFVTPDSQFRDVSGKMLELVPRELVNVRLAYHARSGPGAFAALRYQGRRPFNRRNTFFAEPYSEWDAGLSFDHAAWTVSLVGRNLGDDRHLTTESEIGDSQFYVAPPRRFTAELACRF